MRASVNRTLTKGLERDSSLPSPSSHLLFSEFQDSRPLVTSLSLHVIAQFEGEKVQVSAARLVLLLFTLRLLHFFCSVALTHARSLS